MSFTIENDQNHKIHIWIDNVLKFTNITKSSLTEYKKRHLISQLVEIEKIAISAKNHKGTQIITETKARRVLDLLDRFIEKALSLEEKDTAGNAMDLRYSGEKILEGTHNFGPPKTTEPTEANRLRGLELELASAYTTLKEIRSETAASKAQLKQIEEHYAELKQKISEIQTVMSTSLDDCQNTAKAIIDNLREKERHVDEISGIISGKSIGGSYESSAHNERKLANWTRIGSLLFMIAIAAIIGHSLLATGNPDFDLKTAILRLVFSAALSIPAAYLSRESTRHRNKQYEFQQMSLELQAITPYIASLPYEEQHKLKAEMATRLFGSKGQSSNIDSYPIDIQEILTKVIDKIPSNTSKEGSSTKQP